MTIERIVSAALALIDRQGLEGLSMRNLAQELGSGTATLYRYIRSRDEILVEVVDAVLGQIVPGARPDGGAPPGRPNWREQIESMTGGLRQALLRHPHVTPLFARSVSIGPNALRGREAMLSVLARGGFDPDEAVAVYMAVVHYVIGFVSAEATSSLAYDRRQNDALRCYYRSLPADEFPRLVSLADELTHRDNDREFHFGLRLLLDGVEARVVSNRPSRR